MNNHTELCGKWRNWMMIDNHWLYCTYVEHSSSPKKYISLALSLRVWDKSISRQLYKSPQIHFPIICTFHFRLKMFICRMAEPREWQSPGKLGDKSNEKSQRKTSEHFQWFFISKTWMKKKTSKKTIKNAWKAPVNRRDDSFQ